MIIKHKGKVGVTPTNATVDAIMDVPNVGYVAQLPNTAPMIGAFYLIICPTDQWEPVPQTPLAVVRCIDSAS